jgi:DNA-binding response OmpR family regulator
VLVVDDDEGIRSVVRDLLEEEGYRVLAVEGRADAGTALTAEPISLVLLDASTPRPMSSAQEDGLDDPHPPIVMFSAAADLEARAERAGAVAWIAKPFEIDELLAVVARYTTA